MWKGIRSAIAQYQHEIKRAEVLEREADGQICHRELELFRRSYGQALADAACVGLSKLFQIDQIATFSIHDLLDAPKPKAKKVAREDAAIICLTYLHDAKAVSGRLTDRINPVTLALMRAGIIETCRKRSKFQFRIWNDITNSSAKRNVKGANWVGGGLIPYLLFEHVSIGYRQRSTSDDRLWPRIECELASFARGTRFVLLRKERDNSSYTYDVDDKRWSGTREPSVHMALSRCANWALSGPIFSLATYWESDRQALACLFGRLLKSEHVQDKVRVASAEPKVDPTNLMIVSASDHAIVRKNCCFGRGQEIAESKSARDTGRGEEDMSILKRARRNTVIDGPREPHPELGWRPDIAFLPSCFEYAPLTPATAEANEIRSRMNTTVSVYESSLGKVYALIRNEYFWKERAAVWVSLEDSGSNFKEGRVTNYTRIVADTPEQEIAVAFGLTAARITLRAKFSGGEVNWS